MAIYWRMKSIPELEGMPRKERNRVYYESLVRFIRSSKSRDIKILFVLLVISFVSLMIWIGMMTGVLGTASQSAEYGGFWANAYIWAASVLSGIVIMSGIFPIINGRIRPIIREYLTAGS